MSKSINSGIEKYGDKKDITFIKQELIWHFILLYLDSIRIPLAFKDKNFNEYYQQLYQYVSDKIELEEDCDVIDIFAVVKTFKRS